MSENAVVKYDDMKSMAKAATESRLFGLKSEQEAIGLMMLCQAEGLHPMSALKDYHIISGRPALKADSMLARFQKAGGVVSWEEMSNTRVAGAFSHPQSCPQPTMIEWTFDMAKEAGLTSKDIWKKYPRAMLRARVVSEGVRAVYPACTGGLISVEEAESLPPPTQQPTVAMPKVITATVEPVQPPTVIEVEPEPESATPKPEAPKEEVTLMMITDYIQSSGLRSKDVIATISPITKGERLAKCDPAIYPEVLKALETYVKNRPVQQ
jgi:hypothetical protein